ncbi:putative glycosyl hydrolase protein [Neofusicoccum parvum UCRNP2]|uniref:Putative glycosyl hydrolase protein n=1 Tax=Botryosphaeria parva (strain UCR-NP2) TaxID=1287680 RepID=R1GWF4_BOTPV|nr:putative glycosyl hydrolase protein [Neofusicoccum parvum UCRNP2]
MAAFHEDLRTVSASPARAEAFLPTTTVQAHASNLLRLADGTLLCAWFGGSQEGCADISIHLSRLAPGARAWAAPPQRVSDDAARSEQNPVLFAAPDSPNELWLLYTAQPAGHQNRAVVQKRVSTDAGATWTAASQLFPEVGAFVRQPLVVLDDGTWVLPIWYCRAPPGFQWTGSDDVSAVRFSSDRGASWAERPVPASAGCVHMNIRRVPDGSYLAFFRSRWADRVYRSTSPNGLDWSPPAPTVLPNPNSGIAFDVLPSGRVALVFNDSAASPDMRRREGLYDDITPEAEKLRNQPAVGGREAIWGTPRKALSFGVSDDLGLSWTWSVLEETDGYCMTNNSKDKINREASYPSIVAAEDGEVHVAYTYFRQRIKYVRITEEFALSKPVKA